MWADANADGMKGNAEPSTTVSIGEFTFAIGTTPSALGTLYLNTAAEGEQQACGRVARGGRQVEGGARSARQHGSLHQVA